MARKAKKKPEAGGPNVPAYIVTFSDMVTLLLTFFVMLLSMAQVQDKELFDKSRNAFREYINCYGLGMLTGKQLRAELGQTKVQFKIPDGEEEQPQRSVDSTEETLRRLYNKAAESMETIKSRPDIRFSDFSVTSLRFDPGQSELSASARNYLDQFAAGLKPQVSGKKSELFVLGLSTEPGNAKKQWILSSLRAHRVASYLKESGLQCPVYAWGGGAGGQWIDEESPVSEQSQIFIAICQDGD